MINISTSPLWRLIRPHLRYLFFFSAINNLLLLVPTLFLLQVYDRVLPSRSLETLLMLGLFSVIALLVSVALDHVRQHLLDQTALTMDQRLSQSALSTYLEDKARNQGDRYAQAIKDLLTVRQFFSGQTISAFFDAPWFVIYLVVIFLFHPIMGGVALLGALILCLLTWFTELRSKAQLKVVTPYQRQSDLLYSQLLRNAEVIAALGMTTTTTQAWQSLKDKAYAEQTTVTQINKNGKLLIKAVRQAWQIIMLSLGAWLVIEQHASPGIMLASTILLGKALAPIEQMIGAWKPFLEMRAAWPRLDTLWQLIQHQAASQPVQLPAPIGSLSVEHLVYFPKSAQMAASQRKPILNGLGFQLKPGELLVILGPSASGKSTLARLLTGLYAPDSGAVRLDGAKLADWPKVALAPYLGYVPQDVELFAGTVADNIARRTVGGDTAPVDSVAIVQAAQLARVHDMILRLPQGYETEIGESGQLLSGGQRQRIALARALYGQPKLLILDEPNANLDSEGERYLQDCLRELQQRQITTVLITHRPQLIEMADKVLLLREGTMECWGTPTEVAQWLHKQQVMRESRRVVPLRPEQGTPTEGVTQ